MVDAVRAYALGPASTPELALDARVLEVMRDVPRHLFVPSDQRDRAYEDRPLPIGRGQTVSQPYIVALMTSLLQVEPHHSVLEIGRSEEHTSELQSLMRISYAVFCLKQKKKKRTNKVTPNRK